MPNGESLSHNWVSASYGGLRGGGMEGIEPINFGPRRFDDCLSGPLLCTHWHKK